MEEYWQWEHWNLNIYGMYDLVTNLGTWVSALFNSEILNFSGRTMVLVKLHIYSSFLVYVHPFSKVGRDKKLHVIIILAPLWYFLYTPTRGQVICFISSLMIALDMVTFILYQNTSQNVLLWWSHVILKWKNQLIK